MVPAVRSPVCIPDHRLQVCLIGRHHIAAFYSCMTPVALSGLNAGLLLITCRILLDGNRFEKFRPNLYTEPCPIGEPGSGFKVLDGK